MTCGCRNNRELKMGIRVEAEHTYGYRNKKAALKRQLRIACDHLREFPDYYTRLAKMEREAKKYWRSR